jgi:Bifunctional DNA primase/polymerase, N-terminal/Primase C terminal 2 (PriCT-2)/Family of unknown function (DUF5906)
MTANIVPLRDDKMLRAALAIIQQGAEVIPLWWPEQDRCACGNPACKAIGKHPISKLVPHGVKNASKNPEAITQWWTTCPKANIGIATGSISVLVVVDVDGQNGQAKLAALLSEYGQVLAARNYVETGRVDGGQHYYFKYPADAQVPNRRHDGLEIKSDGGYVVAPPSQHVSGKIYVWRNLTTLEELPRYFADFARAATRTTGGRQGLIDHATPLPSYSQADEARIRSALAVIPAEDRNEEWLRVGAALHSTGWGEPARALFDEWSKKSTKYDPAEQDKLWNSFARGYKRRRITLGTLYSLAKQHGWEEPLPSDIAELNAEYFLIRNIGSKCLVGKMVPNPMGSGEMLSLQSTDDFKKWYANRKSESQPKQKLGVAWLEHPKRRQYEGVDLVPNAPKELPNGKLNLWRGFGVEPKQGSWKLMHQHIHNVLAGGDQKAADYILKWVAWSFQHPDQQAEVALALRGGKGSGKGVFGNAVAKCFGEHGLHIFNQNHLTGNFNAHLRLCLFLFVDEAFWAGDKKAEGVLKGLITERTLMIEQKGIDAVQWLNRLHMLIVANAEWVVPASHDERRFAVFDVSNRYAQGACPNEEREAYFNALFKEIENGGLAAMLYDLLHWNLGNWHPRQVYETEGLRAQKERSLPPLDQWFVALLQEGKLPGYNLYDRSGMFGDNKHNFVMTRTLMDDVRDRVPRAAHQYLSEQELATYLKQWRCIRTKTNEARGWRFPPLAELRAAWARRFSGWRWDMPDLEEWQ